jgi:hypothetical protein
MPIIAITTNSSTKVNAVCFLWLTAGSSTNVKALLAREVQRRVAIIDCSFKTELPQVKFENAQQYPQTLRVERSTERKRKRKEPAPRLSMSTAVPAVLISFHRRPAKPSTSYLIDRLPCRYSNQSNATQAHLTYTWRPALDRNRESATAMQTCDTQEKTTETVHRNQPPVTACQGGHESSQQNSREVN